MLETFLAALVVMAATATFAATLALWRRELDPPRAHWGASLPVLGGEVAETHAWSRYHARFLPMTLVLVAFEMEMMFMYPWAVVFVEEGVTALVEMGVFLVVLSLGVLYAWREGVLRWQ